MNLLNDQNFDEQTKEGIVVVDFFAEWCGPCQMLTPVLIEISEEMKDVRFYKVNIDAESELAKRFNVVSVPTLLLFKDGIIISRTSGYSPKPLIETFIKKAM